MTGGGPRAQALRTFATRQIELAGLKTLANILLVFASIFAALALSELAARTLLPRYDQLADPPQRHHSSSVGVPHPDTGVLHQLAYNNLGLRQHRDFDAAGLRAAVNIAFFGDSFTENRGMAAPYSFTEPLDHLLNAFRGNAGGSGERVNVLNFGVWNTGPGAQYLLYRRAPHRNRFAHVYYVHSKNDFQDLGRSGRWALDAAGGLVVRARDETAAWVRLSSGLHLTYLGLDAWRRLTGAGGPVTAQQARDDAVFRAVVLLWRREVERNGGRFRVAVLPKPGASERFAAVGWPADLEVLDLAACFRGLAPGGGWADDWRFANDSHWNEAGNMLAARCLLRDLAPRLGLPAINADAVKAETRAYYQAFADDRRWDGQRWTPLAPPGATPPRPFAAGEAEAIVSRHLAFGAGADDDRAPAAAMARARRAPARPAGGGWRIHASAAERLLVYVKDPCREAEPANRLFARAHPAHAEDLDPNYHPQGFADLGGDDGRTVWWAERECAVAMALPRFPVARVVAGERRRDGGGVLWRREFPLEAPETLADHRREFRRIAATKPAARAPWRIHHAGDGEIAYLREPCGAEDLRGQFFLRVLPAAASADSARVHDGLVPWILQRHSDLPNSSAGLVRRWYAHHFVALFDNRCLMKAWLPPWRVATVWTGHAFTTPANLWEAKFHLDTERFERALRQARRGQPAAKGLFNVHWTVTREGDHAIAYVREPCSPEDAAARFFLHELTAAGHRPAGDGAGLDMDFDFDSRGVASDNRRVAVAPVPTGVPRVRTGQFNDHGILWKVELQVP